MILKLITFRLLQPYIHDIRFNLSFSFRIYLQLNWKTVSVMLLKIAHWKTCFNCIWETKTNKQKKKAEYNKHNQTKQAATITYSNSKQRANHKNKAKAQATHTKHYFICEYWVLQTVPPTQACVCVQSSKAETIQTKNFSECGFKISKNVNIQARKIINRK